MLSPAPVLGQLWQDWHDLSRCVLLAQDTGLGFTKDAVLPMLVRSGLTGKLMAEHGPSPEISLKRTVMFCLQSILGKTRLLICMSV